MRTDSSPFSTDEMRWEAVATCDREADGHFFYSVCTTGIYCYPSCSARLPHRSNVSFHLTSDDAEQAGFRPCKRCRPDRPPRPRREASLVAMACRTIESAEEPPTLARLASEVGISPHHFHRLFKRVTGVTPKAYAAAHRQRLVQDSLLKGQSVTESFYAAGFNSSGRFYQAAPHMLGMTPTAYRSGGRNVVITYAVGRCSIGHVLVAATDLGSCAILVDSDHVALRKRLRGRFYQADFVAPDSAFADLVARIIKQASRIDPPNDTDLPSDIRQTIFKRRVWEAMRDSFDLGFRPRMRRPSHQISSVQGESLGLPLAGLAQQSQFSGSAVP